MSKVSSASSSSNCAASKCSSSSKAASTATSKPANLDKSTQTPKTVEAKGDDFKGSGELKEHCHRHHKCDKAEEGHHAKPGEETRKPGHHETCDKANKCKEHDASLQEQLDDLKKEIEELKKAKPEQSEAPSGGGGCGGGGSPQGQAPQPAPPAQQAAPMQQAQQTPGLNCNGDLDSQLQQLAMQVLASGQMQPQQGNHCHCPHGGQSGVQGIQGNGNAFAQGFQIGFAMMTGAQMGGAMGGAMGAGPMGMAGGQPNGGQFNVGQHLKASLAQKAAQAKAKGFQPRPETRAVVAQALGQDIFAQQQPQQGCMAGFGMGRAF